MLPVAALLNVLISEIAFQDSILFLHLTNLSLFLNPFQYPCFCLSCVKFPMSCESFWIQYRNPLNIFDRTIQDRHHWWLSVKFHEFQPWTDTECYGFTTFEQICCHCLLSITLRFPIPKMRNRPASALLSVMDHFSRWRFPLQQISSRISTSSPIK